MGLTEFLAVLNLRISLALGIHTDLEQSLSHHVEMTSAWILALESGLNLPGFLASGSDHTDLGQVLVHRIQLNSTCYIGPDCLICFLGLETA